MGILKKKEYDTYCLRNLSGGTDEIYPLEQTQLLIGSSEKADIVFSDKSVNFYHAVVTYIDGAVFITDLCSYNGTKVNGRKLQHSPIEVGDLIELGNVKLEFNETVGTKQIEDTNKKLKFIHTKEEDLPPIPEPTLTQTKRPQASKTSRDKTGHMFYVDGEYVNVRFDESHYKTKKSLEIESNIIKKDFFIEEDEKLIFDVFENNKEFAEGFVVEVIFVSHGNIISYDMIPDDSLSKISSILSDELTKTISFSNDKMKLIENNNGSMTFNVPHGYELKNNPDARSVDLEQNKEYVVEKGVNQIFVRYNKKINKISPTPSWWRDKDELKRVGQKFAMFFIPFLLLLFVNIEQEEENKSVVVIYKQKIEKPQKSSTHSEDKIQDAPKTEESKKVAEEKSDISNLKKQDKKQDQKTKSQNVAKNSSKASEKKAVAAKPRPKISLAANFSKMLGSSQMKSKTFEKSSNSESSSVAESINVAKSSNLSTVGGGSSAKGLGITSTFGNGKGYKSNGSGKSGFDADFTSTKTVVLGAIDPDILRRLLREHIPQFRYCYQEELARNSAIKGVIDLNFFINKSGKAGKTNIISKNGKFTPKGISCITGVLRMINFPKPKGGGVVEVRQPLNFSSEKTKV
ncbi:MAG: AgmX/PglI C-terminal domain-containing protein [Halobacteriovoraceae bacterium]|nr:AgmX/PglI C-terminal domain-containing protein [Halobacteriovoraceae bacterium]